MFTTVPSPQFQYGHAAIPGRRARRLAGRLALARRIAGWL
jgi:hypothetical protein